MKFKTPRGSINIPGWVSAWVKMQGYGCSVGLLIFYLSGRAKFHFLWILVPLFLWWTYAIVLATYILFLNDWRVPRMVRACEDCDYEWPENETVEAGDDCPRCGRPFGV
jgi:hypothetical protein